jgi:MYXO-CTERM domain-containing protein
LQHGIFLNQNRIMKKFSKKLVVLMMTASLGLTTPALAQSAKEPQTSQTANDNDDPGKLGLAGLLGLLGLLGLRRRQTDNRIYTTPPR